jgi:anti-sigma regulatory factor (Ser/Thr protein kinase)
LVFARRYVIELEGSPESPRRARQFFAAVAQRMHLEPEQVRRGEVAVSELVSNAVAHAHGPIRVTARSSTPSVRVEVSDGDSRVPHMNDPGIDADGGRGLPIVAAMADEWGWDSETDQSGKRVWFSLGPVAR